MVFIGGGADAAAVQEYARPLGGSAFSPGHLPAGDSAGVVLPGRPVPVPSSYDTNGLVVREAAASDLGGGADPRELRRGRVSPMGWTAS